MPREALHVSADLGGGGGSRRRPRARRLLLYGAIARGLERRLRVDGAACIRAAEVAAAIEMMAREPFDGLLVEPEAAGALQLIKVLKLDGSTAGQDWPGLEDVRITHRMVPIFVMPLGGEREYAVIVSPPKLSFLERVDAIPLFEAIACLDVARLLDGRQPLLS